MSKKDEINEMQEKIKIALEEWRATSERSNLSFRTKLFRWSGSFKAKIIDIVTWRIYWKN